MRFVFIVKIAEGGEHRIGRRLAKPAERTELDRVSDFVKQGNVLGGSVPACDITQYLQHLVRAESTWHAFAARFFLCEFNKISGDLHHACVFVHNNQAAGTHDSAGFGKLLVVDGYIQELRGNAAARRASGLHGLERLAVGNAAANSEYDITHRDSERHFHQAGAGDLAGKRECLCPAAVLCAALREALAAFPDNNRHVSQGFHVVDVGGFAVQSALRGKRRPRARHAASSLDRCQHSRFFTADESAGALLYLQVKAYITPQDMIAEQVVLPGLRHRSFEALDGQRILCPDVYVAMLRTDGDGCDDHALQYGMRVTLNHRAVHERAGIPLIRVADHVLDVRRRSPAEIPLGCRGKTGAAAPAET